MKGIDIYPYLSITYGLGSILYCLLTDTKYEKLKKTGLKAEGIIFDLDYDTNPITSFNDSNIKDEVTVRFVTKDKEWITGKIKQPFALYITNQYKPGEKVIVYYDPNNPSDFFLDSKQSEFFGRLFVLITGILTLTLGLYLYLATP